MTTLIKDFRIEVAHIRGNKILHLDFKLLKHIRGKSDRQLVLSVSLPTDPLMTFTVPFSLSLFHTHTFTLTFSLSHFHFHTFTFTQGEVWPPAPSQHQPANRSTLNCLSLSTRYTRCASLQTVRKLFPTLSWSPFQVNLIEGHNQKTLSNLFLFIGHEEEATAKEERHLHLFYITFKVSNEDKDDDKMAKLMSMTLTKTSIIMKLI